MLEAEDVVEGDVVKIVGREVSVRTESGSVSCYLRGRLFVTDDSGERTQLAVGDRVALTPIGDAKGVIHKLLSRRNTLVRQVGRARPRLQVLAANVDQIVVVSALKRPHYRTGLVDRYLVIARGAGCDAILCLNKIDQGDDDALAAAREDFAVYESLGYPLVWTSATTGAGIDELSERLRDRRSVLAGHSGVGKSKLASALMPGVELASAKLDRRGKGRHTTSASTLFPLEHGGELVDTPGIRELSIAHLDRRQLAHGFVELEPFLDGCHFPSCSHIAEPYCRVKAAVASEEVSASRYESYCRLYEELGSG